MRTFLFAFLLSLVSAGTFAQAGMREVYGAGYTFDAEKYKVDVALQKLKNQPIPYYQPEAPKYSYSNPPKEVVKVYTPPKYPKDTLVYELSDFTMQSNQVYGPDLNAGKANDKKLPVNDTLILRNTYKPVPYASYAIGNYFTINGFNSSFNANEGIYCLLRKVGESDKKFFGIKVTIQLPDGQDAYFFWINNKGESRIDQYLWNKSIETVAKKKTPDYIADKINEIAIVKNAEKLSFLCNGKEVHSIILEHPWVRFSDEKPLIVVETGVDACLYSYRNVWFPY